MRTRWKSLFEPKRHPEMDVETLTGGLRSALGKRLKSVVLFGSMAGEGFDERRSNVNILIVSDLSFEALELMGPAMKGWLKEGHLPPVLVAPDDLDDFARDFPIEFLDMQETHKVVWGEDPLRPLTVGIKYLEAQVEHDLALVQLRLRQSIAAAGGDETKIRRAIIGSVPSVLTLFRAALKTDENVVKLDKIKAAERLATRLGLDAESLRRLWELHVHRESDDFKFLAPKLLQLIASVLEHLRKR